MPAQQRKPVPKAADSNGDARPGHGVPSSIAQLPTSVRLTATQRHYLLKLLICAEMHDEWSLLDEKDGLKQYGAPFVDGGRTPSSVGQQSALHPEHTQKPMILLHLFHVHLRRFPGLDRAKVDYWRKQIAPFFDQLANSHMSNSVERSELTNRKLLNITATRYFSTFFARGVGVRGQDEQRGPGKGQPGSEAWGAGKQWGRGTVKRGLEKPLRPEAEDVTKIDALFGGGPEADASHANKGGDDGERLWEAGAANSQRVRRDWSAWKESIIESEGGLDETLKQLETKFMNNLPDKYRNAAEWVRRHVAFVAWTLLVRYPGGDEIFAIIKTIHTLFPYWGAKQLLKIANAQKMIKAIIDLVLARPLGAIDSLGQRIFFTIMRAEIDKINKRLMTPLRKSIDDREACDALEDYTANRTVEQRGALLQQAHEQGCDVLIPVLEAYGYGRMQEVRAWQEEYARSVFFTNVDRAYPESCLEAKYLDQPSASVREQVQQASSGARKFAQLKLYLREALRRRDRKEVLSIGSGPLVPTLIRQSLEIVFYKLFYDIAQASNLSARLQDFQNFIDDLIRVKTQKKDSLEDYVALAARHEGNLYMFVHEVRDAVKPVFDWCQTALDFMALSTTEPWNPSNVKAPRVEVNLDAMLSRAASEKDDQAVDMKAVLAELEAVERFAKWDKMRTEVAMRKEYALIHDDAVTNVTLCQWSRGGLQKGLQTDDDRVQPTIDTRTRLEDLDGLMAELLQRAGLEPDKGTIEQGGARGTDTAQVPWGFFMPDDVLMQRYADKIRGLQLNRSYPVDGVQVAPPTVPHIRSLLPAFRAELAKCLPDWSQRASNSPLR